MIICLCNNFNETVLTQGIRALAQELPAQPNAQELEDFYHRVYEYCGREYHGAEGVMPDCYSCFHSFINLILEEQQTGKNNPCFAACPTSQSPSLP